MEKVEFKCQALGSPNPKYTWVDKEGIDATEKEGKFLSAFKRSEIMLSRLDIRRNYRKSNSLPVGKERCRRIYMYC